VKPGQLRLLVRVLVFVALAVLGKMVFPALMQPFGDPLVVAALSSFAAGAVANAVLARGWESGKPSEFGLGWSRDSAREIATGIACGAGGAALIVGVSMVLRLAVFESVPNIQRAWAGIPVLTIVLFFGSAGEELLFHGYGFQQLVRGVGEFATVLPVGILFGLAHLGNQGVTLLAILNTIAWGVLLGCAYLRTRALWLPIGLHFGWNVAMPFLGVNLSGFTMGVTGYVLRWRTEDLWSGGAYGLEGGLFTTLLVIALFFLLYRVIPERGNL
jgi:membrane protease YdiL (CAAX protease family)